MALIVATLSDALRSFLDPDFSGFVDFPADEVDAASKWSAAIDLYTGSGLLVTPPSTAGPAAKEAMAVAMLGMSAPGVGPVFFDVAFLAYATALGAGMLPAFVATPPPIPLSTTLVPSALAAVVPGGVPPSIQVPILAGIIDLWFRTATVTPSGGGVPVPWA
jgi:hypothetical protein